MNAIGLIYKNDEIKDKDKISFLNSLKSNGSNVVHEKNFMLVDATKSLHGRSQSLKDERVNVLLYGYIVNIQELIDEFKISKKYSVEGYLCSLYRILGENFVERLRGSFALILFDKKKQKVIAAKDHASMKPLYYYGWSGNLIVATNQSAIYTQKNFSRSINETRVSEYLNGILQKSDHNFFNQILSVPRSSYIVFENGKIKVKKYFSFDIDNPIILKSDKEYAECTREFFFRTLSNHVKIFNKFASKISGGLDSTSICCALSKISGNSNFPCINIDYEGLDPELLAYSNEEKYVDSATSLSSLNTFKKKIRIGDFPVISFLREMYATSDIPIPSFNHGFQIATFQELKKLGYEAVFDGFDGDSAISFGKERLLKLRREHDFINFFYEKSKYTKKHGLRFSTLGTLKHIFITALEQKKIISDHALHRDVFNYYGWDYALEYTENSANQFEIEEVYPFFDRDFMQYLISIPSNQKLKHGISRFHFRNAMKNIIPDNVRKRTSKGVLSRLWIQEVRNIDLRELELIFKKTNSDYFFDTRNALEELEKFKLASDTDHDAGKANNLFQKVSLSLWLEKYS